MNNPTGGSLLRRQQGVVPRNTSRDRETNEYWGAAITKRKSTNCARIAFQNINGIPIKNNIKIEAILDVVREYEFDYFGVQEINTHERILAPTQQWKRRFPYHHTQAATNEHFPSQRKILHGGTAHFLNHDLCLRQITSGKDITGLGRWIWTLLQGRQGIQVRLISGYRPIEDKSNRPHSVYSQHEYYFNNIC